MGAMEALAKTGKVQTYGRKKTAVAVALCKTGSGLMRINGCPMDLIRPEVLKMKVYEPILLLGKERFAGGHPRSRSRWWYGLADLCDSSGDRKGHCRVLPEVRG